MFCAARGGPGGRLPTRGEALLAGGEPRTAVPGGGCVALRPQRPNQERVLGALEELGWPPRIDNPLPLKKGKRQRKRLCDTLRHLSAAQRAIRFRISADGRAVLWAPDGGG
jgi:hypothetical protein